MLRPSYSELMDVLNKGQSVDNKITSRYIVVIAAAKRARQIIEGTAVSYPSSDKAVSIAVDEIKSGKITIRHLGNAKEGLQGKDDIDRI